MTPDQLRQYGEALYGERWQTPMARFLGMNDAAQIRKWVKGARTIPGHVEARLKTLMGLDDFIVGNGASGKEYIVHTRPPRFVCTIFVEGEDEPDVDDLSGETYPCEGCETLCGFVWWDKPPQDEEKAALLKRAEAALIEDSLLP